MSKFASNIGSSQMTVDNQSNPNSALNKMKSQPKANSLSPQAKGMQQNLSKTYQSVKGKTFGTNLK